MAASAFPTIDPVTDLGWLVARKGGVECGAILADEFAHRVGSIPGGTFAFDQTTNHRAADDHAIGDLARLDGLLGATDSYANQNR